MWLSAAHQGGANSVGAEFPRRPAARRSVLPSMPETALYGWASPVTQDSTGEGTMKTVGWEIRPLGWLLVIVVLVALSYLIVKWVRRLPPALEQ